MKKKLLLALLFAAQTTFAQIISKDPTFASNGIHTITNPIDTNWSRIAQSSDGNIYFSYSKTNSGINESFLSKLTINGALDPSFGTNGEIKLPYYSNDAQLKIQPDGKLLILGFSSSGIEITRILSTGQIDFSFGTNGTTSIPALSSDADVRSYGIVLQNGNILVHGIDTSNGQVYQHRIYRLNSFGIIDTPFGNNGSVFTQGSWSDTSFLMTDNQSNIIVLTNSGILQKFSSNGQPIVNFGTNGTYQMSQNLNHAGAVFIDSSNRIVYSNINDEIFRINSDGTLDSTFNYNLYTHSGINGGAWILSIVEKNGNYYVGGTGEGDFANTYFISKLNQNGAIDSSFSYFSESNTELSTVLDMTVNNDNILASGNGHIVKYLINNGNLSTSDHKIKHSSIIFENPVYQNLIFSSKEKIAAIEIFSTDGKYLKTVKLNNSDISELNSGIYILKVISEKGAISSHKRIKR